MAFLIYMITTFTLNVPDWSFVDRVNGDEPERYTVHNFSYSLMSKSPECYLLGTLSFRFIFIMFSILFSVVCFCLLLGDMWDERTPRPCM